MIFRMLVISLFISLFSCKTKYSIDYNYNEANEVLSLILEIERLEGDIKLKKSYENRMPEYYIDQGGIFFSYSSLNEDSLKMNYGVPDRNKQNITNIDIIPNLNIVETSKLKDLIIRLCNKGVCSQEFIPYDYDVSLNKTYGIYLYRYIDVREGCDNMGCIAYLTILTDCELQQKWFTNRFVVEDHIENLYLIRRLI